MTLTIDQMPGHDHAIHSGGFDLGSKGVTCRDNYTKDNQGYLTIAGGSQSHAHGLAGDTGQTNTLPPYYSLNVVMRIA